MLHLTPQAVCLHNTRTCVLSLTTTIVIKIVYSMYTSLKIKVYCNINFKFPLLKLQYYCIINDRNPSNLQEHNRHYTCTTFFILITSTYIAIYL